MLPEPAVAVSADPPELAARAEALAERLGLAVCANTGCGAFELLLVVTPGRIELRHGHARGPGPIYADFVAGRAAGRARRATLRGEPLARAAGLKGGHRPVVLDLTAGLGRDGYLLAALGCRVTMVERSPVVAALLRDGLERAAAAASTAVARIRLVEAEGSTLLDGGAAAAESVYLDPMYPARGKSALPQKEMRALRRLVGEDADAPELLAAALRGACHRVVVKRPHRAPCLAGPPPDAVLPAGVARFDVYLAGRGRGPIRD